MPLILESSYPGAPSLLWNGTLQTIFPFLFRKVDKITYNRERLTLPDNDFVDLDWLQNKNKRLLIVSHGLEGSSNGIYVKGVAKEFHKNDWDVLAWNCRSCSGEINKNFRLYGNSNDLESVVDHAIKKHGYQKIVLLGYSMGGNFTLKYLGEKGQDLPVQIKGGIAISTPCRLEESVNKLDIPKNWLFRWRYIPKLKEKMLQKAEQYPDLLDKKMLDKIFGFKDLDKHFAAPLNGYKDAEEFYAELSSEKYLSKITVPTLILNSKNDPVLTDKCHPIHIAIDHANVYLELTESGGHVGFPVKGLQENWSDKRALEFVEEKMFLT